MTDAIRDRLEYLRGEIRAGRISYGELHELQCMAEHIEPGDTELLEAAGVPEFPDEDEDCDGCGGKGAVPGNEPGSVMDCPDCGGRGRVTRGG